MSHGDTELHGSWLLAGLSVRSPLGVWAGKHIFFFFPDDVGSGFCLTAGRDI